MAVCAVGLLCILAQAGFWVPAKEMLISPFRSIVSHIAVQKQSYGSTSSMVLEAEVWHHGVSRCIHARPTHHCMHGPSQVQSPGAAVQHTCTPCHVYLVVQSISYLMKQIEQSQGTSLALIDELATSTTSLDGMAIAWAVSEKLIQLEASTFVATHFTELDRLPGMYPTAKTSHMECEDQV
eukprot:jgi/Ulvmu1/8099/UM004_0338.1